FLVSTRHDDVDDLPVVGSWPSGFRLKVLLDMRAPQGVTLQFPIAQSVGFALYRSIRGDLRLLAPRKKLLNSPRILEKPRASLARGFLAFMRFVSDPVGTSMATETSRAVGYRRTL